MSSTDLDLEFDFSGCLSKFSAFLFLFTCQFLKMSQLIGNRTWVDLNKIGKSMLNFRQKRLFFVSSSSTTSTLSTTTLCFVSSTSAVTTCGKRKRALGVHELGDLADIQIASSAVLR